MISLQEAAIRVPASLGWLGCIAFTSRNEGEGEGEGEIERGIGEASSCALRRFAVWVIRDGPSSDVRGATSPAE